MMVNEDKIELAILLLWILGHKAGILKRHRIFMTKMGWQGTDMCQTEKRGVDSGLTTGIVESSTQKNAGNEPQKWMTPWI